MRIHLELFRTFFVASMPLMIPVLAFVTFDFKTVAGICETPNGEGVQFYKKIKMMIMLMIMMIYDDD